LGKTHFCTERACFKQAEFKKAFDLMAYPITQQAKVTTGTSAGAMAAGLLKRTTTTTTKV
jgi:hypothetical protein